MELDWTSLAASLYLSFDLARYQNQVHAPACPNVVQLLRLREPYEWSDMGFALIVEHWNTLLDNGEIGR